VKRNCRRSANDNPKRPLRRKNNSQSCKRWSPLSKAWSVLTIHMYRICMLIKNVQMHNYIYIYIYMCACIMYIFMIFLSFWQLNQTKRTCMTNAWHTYSAYSDGLQDQTGYRRDISLI
jgi:hypothetical protein